MRTHVVALQSLILIPIAELRQPELREPVSTRRQSQLLVRQGKKGQPEQKFPDGNPSREVRRGVRLTLYGTGNILILTLQPVGNNWMMWLRLPTLRAGKPISAST